MFKWHSGAFLGIALALFAVGIAIIPQFTSCQSQGKAIQLANGKTVPMKCNWTAQAGIAVAVPTFAVGALMITSRKKESMRNLGVLGVLLGAVTIALPTKLIGVCSSAMLCNTVMKPSMVSLGALAVGISLVGIVLSFRKNAE